MPRRISTTELITYNVKVPRKWLLIAAIVLGGACVASGLTLVFLPVAHRDDPSSWVLFIAILCVVGAILAASALNAYIKFYRVVRQGRVVDIDWRPDADAGGAQYDVLVEGHTLSNDLRRSWYPTNYSYTPPPYKIGDFVDFR